MKKIEKLTPEQESYLPKFRQEMLDIACKGSRINRDNLQTAINDAYAVIDKQSPALVILDSPFQAMLAINLLKSISGDKLGDRLG